VTLAFTVAVSIPEAHLSASTNFREALTDEAPTKPTQTRTVDSPGL
jgi:hypothetical protein